MAINKETIQSMIKEAVAEHSKQNASDDTTPSTGHMDHIRSNVAAEERQKSPTEPGHGVARVLRALAFSRNDQQRAVDFARKAQEQSWRDDLGDQVVKSLQAGNFEAAGFLLEPQFTSEIIELLRNRTVIRRAGARSVPMPNGSMTMPKQTDSASAHYIGEAQAIPESQPEGGHVQMSAKKLVGLVPVSNELLTFTAGNQADAFVRDDLLSTTSIREDQAFYRGSGTQYTPRGLRWWAVEDNVLESNGTAPEEIEQDFTDLVNALEAKNVPLDTLALFMTPKVKNNLANKRDSAGGNLLFPNLRMVESPNIWGIPVYTTNSIPSDLNGGNTEIVLARMSDVLIGESMNMQLTADPNASYVDGSGQTISAFQNDLTLIRAISMHDFMVRREESVAVMTNVAYGNNS